MKNNIEGKVVVITGGSSGLGEATARYLAEKGAKVVLGARRVEKLEKIASEIKENGGEAVALKTDVTKAEDVKALVKKAKDTFGKIDVLINNAGIMPLAPKHKRCAIRNCCCITRISKTKIWSFYKLGFCSWFKS